MKTFQDATKKYKVREQIEKTEAVAMVGDLFGSVLFLSSQRKLNMAEVFCYPLKAVPLSLCHTDGTILSAPKSKLLTELESRVKSEASTKIDAAVVDGMFFLHLLMDPPKNFKQIAIYLLRKMFNSFNCKNIYLVFDKVVSPSIKDLERNKRSSTRQDLFTITDQLRHGQVIGKQLWKWIRSKLHLSNSSCHIGKTTNFSPFLRTSSCL